MCWVPAKLVYPTSLDGWRHLPIRYDIVDACLPRIFIDVACGLAPLSIAFRVVRSYVRPPLLLQHVHDSWKCLQWSIEIPADGLGPRFHIVELHLYDRYQIICAGGFLATFSPSCPSIDGCESVRDPFDAHAYDFASSSAFCINVVIDGIREGIYT